MTNKELNKWLVVNVMGWKEGKEIGYAPMWYYEKKGEEYFAVILIDGWQPTENKEQAIQIAVELCKQTKSEMHIDIIVNKEGEVSFAVNFKGEWTFDFSLSQAICQAIKKAKEFICGLNAQE